MRVFLLMFVVALSLTSGARAQLETGQVNSVLIPYSRQIPKSVLRSMPSGAKSLYWGRFTPRKGKAAMGVHVFAPKRKLKDRYESIFTYSTKLELWEKTKRGFKRLNVVTQSYDGRDEDVTSGWKTRLHFLWLDQNDKRVPVIALDSIAKESALPGPYGGTIFLIFDETWKRPAKVHNFGFGSSDNGSYAGYGATRNAEGKLEITQTQGDGSGSYSSVYVSNGTDLVIDPQRSTSKSNY